MSSAPEELLAARRVRAAEMALEAARARVRTAEEEIELLRAQVSDLEAALEASLAARRADADAWRARFAEADARVLAANQRAHAERDRRMELQVELMAALEAAPTAAGDPLDRQLAAERRVRELEAELELVVRQAAEFEQRMRVALERALAELRADRGRVQAALARLAPLRSEPPAESEPPLERLAPLRSEPPAVSEPPLERLDQALARLRAATPATD